MCETKLNPVRQAVITAGGYGRRMGAELNPHGCKSLIEYGGQSMLAWLLDGLIEGGIEDFVVATNEHSDKPVKEILESKQIPASTAVISPDGFRAVPYQTADRLDERFLLVCGHHPVSPEHVRRMRIAAEVSSQVITAYDSEESSNDKEIRIIAGKDKDGTETYRKVHAGVEPIPLAHLYIRNPYIVNANIAQKTHADNFRYTFSYYLYQSWLEGESLAYVEADMPPEFDYPDEYALTQQYLSRIAIVA